MDTNTWIYTTENKATKSDINIAKSNSFKDKIKKDDYLNTKIINEGLFKPLIAIAIITMAIMTIYELLKQEVIPKISIWESHLITIIFTSITAPVAAYFILKRINDLKNKLAIELHKTNLAQEKLNEINDQLEYKVKERTKELSQSNAKLEKEIFVRQQTEKKLKQNELKYRLLFERSPSGILSFNNSLKITQINAKFTQLFKLTETELINFDLTKINNSKLVNTFKETLKGHETVFEGEYKSILNNESNTILLKTTPIFDKDGLIIGGIATVDNITKQKEFEAALIKAKENAEKSNMLKSEFLAQISHEIRTPINAVLSFSSLLKEEVSENIDDDLKMSFEIIEKQGKRITRTIDMLVNISEIQSKTYEPLNKEVCLYSEIVLKVLKNYEKDAKDKNLNMFTNADIADYKIITDSYSVTQIIEQLIDNAIKYTEKGSININLKKKADYVVTEIIDTGIGISDEYKNKLFGLFSQEEQGYSRRYEGNGLGLAIVNGFCKLNNITLQINSVKGEGTKVSLLFPLQKN